MVASERTDNNLMDIVTHAGIGLIAALPFANSRPELALGIVAGSVLPDLDALSRFFGKRAFMRMHQTWSHALPVQLVVSVLAGAAAHRLGFASLLFGVGLFLGMMAHSLLDLSNTLGVTLFAPFSRKRICLAWVFFIDAFVLAATVTVASWMLWEFYRKGDAPPLLAAAFFGAMVFYFGAKGLLHRRAAQFGTVSLVPSALCPWQFLATEERDGNSYLFSVNAITRSRKILNSQPMLDGFYLEQLSTIPEFRMMRDLSPAYHVIRSEPDATGERLLCRDLRTRNFNTTFGDLEVKLDANKRVVGIEFHV
jgi:membrane-bound metal-dependent hydrolase YbcI (DUF457 family)